MELFAEDEGQQAKKSVPDAPTRIKGADVLREYLLLAEKPAKFSHFARRKSR